jgi:lysyl-tRNA synthetase, class II
MRSKAINDLRKSKNPDPYPHKFQTTMSIPDFVEKFSYLKRGEDLKDTQVALAGRIMVKRDSNKLKFYDLHGEVCLSFLIY